MTSTSEVRKYEKRGSTAWLTMNRPHAMNAFNTELRNGLVEAIQRATADPDILSIVLTGEGGRAFSAGADLKEVARRDVKKDAPPPPERDQFLHHRGQLPQADHRGHRRALHRGRP